MVYSGSGRAGLLTGFGLLALATLLASLLESLGRAQWAVAGVLTGLAVVWSGAPLASRGGRRRARAAPAGARAAGAAGPHAGDGAVDHVSRRWMLVSAVILGTLAFATRSPERRAQCVGTLVPAYVPPEEFAELAGPNTLIVNPASGPGERPSAAYRWAIERVQASGARVLGYVATTYASATRRRSRPTPSATARGTTSTGSSSTRSRTTRPICRTTEDCGSTRRCWSSTPAWSRRAATSISPTWSSPTRARSRTTNGAWPTSPSGCAKSGPHTSSTPLRASRRAHCSPDRRRSTSLYVTSGVQPNPWGDPPPYLQDERSTQCP